MNLQSIERLKGLLARVELNAKKPRTRRAMAKAAPAVEIAITKESLPPVSLSPDELELEDVALDEFAVELSPVAPPAAALAPSAAVSGPSLASAAAIVDLEDVSAEDVGLEDMGLEEIAEEQPILTVSAPVQTAVQASPKPFTVPPELEELTFSEPPPAPSLPPLEPVEEEIQAPPVSSRQVISEAPDSIDAALMAAAQAEAEEAEEREAPLLTPPPESGRQPTRPATTGFAAEVPTYRQAAPTVEQLGEVVELEELTGPSLELAEAPSLEMKHKREPEELEFVPRAAATQATQAREPMPTLVGEFPEELPPSSRKGEQPVAVLTAELTARRPVAPSAPVINVIALAQAFRPSSFLELLDASLKLGKH